MSDALLNATLVELAEGGYAGTTIAGIARRAGTSKQAIYRRFPDKTALAAAALANGFLAFRPDPPLRGSVAEDLRRYLIGLAKTLTETPLGGAIRSLSSYRHIPEIAAVFEEAENGQRLALRQVLIATPFEADMETRIDLLLGLVSFGMLVRGYVPTAYEFERAIHLVLGLVAPRDPRPFSGLPGT
ncbi:TetR/AcrR family transcriptional regulator [uncultured Roseibium sp.]|uniref:TetR/AcrR family transcriptional regulator n=1 Tax=uncultured Roseibium sp. TaxID=1936171 RepID=UPI0026235286|nr:TetR/AcrR family transcriptional regulator [uncultured Roseibium sp.]